MNTATAIDALAAVTVPAEDLIFFLLRIVADMQVIQRLEAIGLFVAVVVYVIDRQEKRLSLAAAGAFVAQQAKQFLFGMSEIFRIVFRSPSYAPFALAAFGVIFTAANQFAGEAGVINFPDSDFLFIMAGRTESSSHGILCIIQS